ncbi:MAG: NBR1-Ig-like domain-containing protein [Chloroflexi bacterium]|nr:NBR1-Ig-like domain-containing protein [Chloroflexota bacterium]
MDKRRLSFSFSVLALVLSMIACNLPNAAVPTSQVVVVTATPPPGTTNIPVTSPSEIVQVSATTTPSPVPNTLTPTATNLAPTETPTQTPTQTVTSVPCNQVAFVEDVTYPDDTVIVTSKSFTKTWRFKNTGSCTWTSGYQLVFTQGDKMSGPDSQPLTNGTVPPNGTVDVSVSLVSPSSEGTFRGYWKMRDPQGVTFGLKSGAFWVQIVTKAPAALPGITLVAPVIPLLKIPDLYVSEFTISPSTPIKGQPAHVRIGVYNKGTGASSHFNVSWFGLSTYVNPSCAWGVPSLAANGGLILECDFAYPSSYALNLSTKVVVDTTNLVLELDESNNQRTISPFGVKP